MPRRSDEFRVRSWVVPVVLAVAVLIGVYAGIRHEIEGLVTDREVEAVAEQARVVAAQIERSALLPEDLRAERLSPERIEAIDGFTATYVSGEDRLEMLLFALDGTILFATDRDRIGGVSASAQAHSSLTFDELAASARRELAAGRPRTAEVELEDGIHETYVPVFVGDAAGILELYYDFGASQASISQALRRVEIVLALGLLGLVFACFPVARKVVARLHTQRLELDRAELERRNNEIKDLFLDAVSHELRTPLHGVVSGAETLRLRGGSLTGTAAARLVEVVHRNAVRLDALLGDLLDLRRLTSGIIEPRRRPTDLVRFVETVLESVDADEHPLTLDVEDVVVHVDTAMLERALENLLRNAVRYTPAGTDVRLQAGLVGDDLVLVVEDDGPGVAVEHRERVLRAFERGDNPEHAPGTGLGLAVVAEFARLHGGDAEVGESDSGGARFTIHFADARTPTGGPDAADPRNAEAGAATELTADVSG